ncbi:MAG: hypothetical protein II180_00485, partial [Proteobacteria bacterium]|nr:hypothetical protein [Pseudomonadota bacterium]
LSISSSPKACSVCDSTASLIGCSVAGLLHDIQLSAQPITMEIIKARMDIPHEQMVAVPNAARTQCTCIHTIVPLCDKMSKRRVFPKGIAALSERMGG